VPRESSIDATPLAGGQGVAAGFDAHLGKPVDIDHLVATIARLCPVHPWASRIL